MPNIESLLNIHEKSGSDDVDRCSSCGCLLTTNTYTSNNRECIALICSNDECFNHRKPIKITILKNV